MVLKSTLFALIRLADVYLQRNDGKMYARTCSEGANVSNRTRTPRVEVNTVHLLYPNFFGSAQFRGVGDVRNQVSDGVDSNPRGSTTSERHSGLHQPF